MVDFPVGLLGRVQDFNDAADDYLYAPGAVDSDNPIIPDLWRGAGIIDDGLIVLAECKGAIAGAAQPRRLIIASLSFLKCKLA